MHYMMLCFQGEPLPGMPGSQVGPVPIISMYGVTMAGNSIAVYVHGFAPYFYVPAVQGFKTTDCVAFRVSQQGFCLIVVTLAFSNLSL
jgi:hypothetical protein